MNSPPLDFVVEGVEPLTHAAAPTLAFRLRVACGDALQEIQNVILQCQIQIECTRRRYSSDEQERLVDLFGAPSRWGDTLRGMLWTHASAIVPPFTGAADVQLNVPCTFDFNVAATKYFHGLEEGEVPLILLFSGTVFYRDAEDNLQTGRISWEKEARYRLPVEVWKQMMDHYYPNSAWLCFRRDVFDQLCEYKMRHAMPTWEQAFEQLLDSAAEHAS